MSADQSIPTPAPADRPNVKIQVDGTAINPEYAVQSIVVNRAFNRVASADIVLYDGDPASQDFKLSSAPEFVPGKEIEILAGYHGDEQRIFKGIVIRHGVRVYARKPSILRVECKDATVKLTVGRKNAYYYEATDAEIIETLASNAGLDSEVEATAVSHAEMVQYYATDWDFIVTRAEANGKRVLTLDGKLIVKKPSADNDPVLSLAYGGNLLDFEAVMDACWQYTAVSATAWDAANQEALEIEGVASGAVGPGNLGESDLAAVIGLESLQLRHGGQLKDDELQAWADGKRLQSGYSGIRGRARIQGFGGVLPGDSIDLAGVGERFTGKALVSGVRHEIDSRNWESDVSFGLAPEDFAAQQDDVMEPPASGLLPGIGGLHIGVVTALEGDPDGEDRIQVQIPIIDAQEQGLWARVASLDAGDNRGAFFRPEVGDEVVLGFLNQDPRQPVVLGMLNSSAKPAPLAASDDNHQKGFFSRSGIKLLFDDETSTVSIETPNGNTVVLSDADGAVSLSDENDNTVVLNSDGITLQSAGNISLTADGDVTIEGSNVSATANTQFSAAGSAGAELTSDGNAVVKGSIVQIN